MLCTQSIKKNNLKQGLGKLPGPFRPSYSHVLFIFIKGPTHPTLKLRRAPYLNISNTQTYPKPLKITQKITQKKRSYTIILLPHNKCLI